MIKVLKSIEVSVLLIGLTLTAVSCKKVKNTDANVIDNKKTDDSSIINYTSEQKYNVNIIYFIPTDNPAIANYESRLSAILLQGQGFFKTWMNHHGFGNKTFGLMADKNKGRVKITTIMGKFPKSEYVSGKHDNMAKEINEYFVANPTEKASDHYLVIQPVHSLSAGLPYYGVGRWAYICDVPEMNVSLLGTTGDAGTKATTYIGGLLHELGHALNLPHNKQKASEGTNVQYGTTLMGSGNYTYGKSPTFLSYADCATLNHNQVFSTVEGEFYKSVTVKLKNIVAEYKSGNILVSGKFQSSVPVSDVAFYNDPADDGADYDAQTWNSKVTNNEDFSISMPVAEFTKKGYTPYALRIRLCHTNGSLTTFGFSYTFNNDIPVVDFGIKASQYDKTTWSVIDFSTNETSGEDGKVANVIDNNLSSSWLSRWSSSPGIHPHQVTIDMKQSLTVKGLTIAMEQKYDTKSKDIELLTSLDGTIWVSRGNHVLKEVAGPQHIYLSSTVDARYIKLIINSAWNTSKAANIAEIGVFNE